MRAITVRGSGRPGMRISEVPDPRPREDEILVSGVELGICGTDREICSGLFGTPPPGRSWFVLGHEGLGRVSRVPPSAHPLGEGTLVIGVVRRPDPEPCAACSAGEAHGCLNGRYTETGITSLDGYGSELWTARPEHLVPVAENLRDVGILIEPASVVAKAWETIAQLEAGFWSASERVLVTGAGPIGLLAALFARQREREVHVFDRDGGLRAALVRDLGAHFHSGCADEVARRVRPDVVVETTAAPEVISGVSRGLAPHGVLCLLGIAADDGVAAPLSSRSTVLGNHSVFGSVSAGLRHFQQAQDALLAAPVNWLPRFVTRRLPLEEAEYAVRRHPEDVKVSVVLGDA
ncbi:alcohol dehydrogenase catalytic domain-containing protein [Streptomyces sp. NPDC006995]|uniref:alcohol dehydrogenase catalytic domain-containing protein n=2 Tax=unclassified Streptomyces TaxID=2593676 RepID=UPI0033C69F5C